MKRAEGPMSERFSALDFHDDILVRIAIHPPKGRKSRAGIDLEFRDDATGKKKMVRFLGCGNILYAMDFDVLSSNWFAQTDRLSATNDAEQMRRFVERQARHWHTKYMPPQEIDAPIRGKLRSIHAYRLFRITFFGGTLEILARRWTQE